MSYARIPIIMERISLATLRSPVAVFTTRCPVGNLNAMFASTIMTQHEIDLDDGSLVGVFTRDDHAPVVERKLEKALGAKDGRLS